MIVSGGTTTLGVYDFKAGLDEFGKINYWVSKVGGYPTNKLIMLSDGTVVQNTLNGNVNNPNTNLTGWKYFNSNSNFLVFSSISDLLAYPTPTDGEVVYVESYYTNEGTGGGFFKYNGILSDVNNQGTIINGWVREQKQSYSVDDFGALPSGTAEDNGDRILLALTNCDRVFIPPNEYPCKMDKLVLKSNNYLFGGGILVGTDPDIVSANVTGTYLRLDNCENVIIDNITIKNGYKGKGVWMTNSRNIKFLDFTIDGFSYGVWCGESDDSVGCSNIEFIRPKILNTRYWGMYFRCLNVSVEENKTKDIRVINPYFYNANMAAFVCAEGNVRYVTLENPRFERCNVCMHFETTTDYTVINARDTDTGKKPDHLPANTEYPYTNWSMYHAFASRGKIIGGKLEKTCYHYAENGGGSEQIEYHGTTALDFVFDGGGSDTSKVFFQKYLFNACTSQEALIYQLAGADHYLRDFTVIGCTSLIGKNDAAGTGDGNKIVIFAPRTVNFRFTNNTVYNACVRLAGFGNMFVTNNNFIGGTNNTQNQFNGISGAQLAGNNLEFTGNIFERAGGSVLGTSAFLISNFSRVRTDNCMRIINQYGYSFNDNYRVEYGNSYVLGWTTGAYTQTGTVDFVTLYGLMPFVK